MVEKESIKELDSILKSLVSCIKEFTFLFGSTLQQLQQYQKTQGRYSDIGEIVENVLNSREPIIRGLRYVLDADVEKLELENIEAIESQMEVLEKVGF